MAAACGGSNQKAAPSIPKAKAAPPALPPAPADVDGHLPATAVPERYRVSLQVDPSKERYAGVASIDVRIPSATSHVVLNARDMQIVRATATVGARAVAPTIAWRPAPGTDRNEELVLTFAEPLPAGAATLEIAYEAPFAPDLAGLYRVEQDGKSYVYSQFEAVDARRAMPCFDEPEYKTPFEITVTAPKGLAAFSNAPEASVSGDDTTAVHRFAPTPPLPTYLVAVAVGDFDVAEGRKTPVPIRVITPKGQANQVAAALEAADALVTQLSSYFGMPYPYAKLDLVAVPDLSSGAMENAGLLTFRSSLIVLDPGHATTGLRRRQAVVIAHELAHQWFGDLVTMQWWDDLWLNEGFATWAEEMAVDAWQPSFGATLDARSGIGHVMDEDALSTARAVRQPVHSALEAEQAFDGLTYDKGAGVLRMIERWLGPVTFRRGVQRYLREAAWKNARASDLFRALDYVSGERVEPFASAFLDHAGVPEVFARTVCKAGRGSVELRQGRWVPLGEPAPASPLDGADATWTLPVCVTAEGHKGVACFTVGKDPIARELGPGCPAWLHPNADQVGYYRFVVDAPQLLALARAGRALDPVQRVAVVSNAWAAVRAGELAPSALLDVLRAFDGETDRRVLGEIVSVLHDVGESLVDDSVVDRYRKFVAARVGARKRDLKWEPPPGPDDEDRTIARQIVLLAMGDLARDETTLTEAESYAEKWLKEPAKVPGDVAAVAVPLASRRANKGRLAELEEFASHATSIEQRAIVEGAMGAFDDPAILFESFDYAIGGGVRLSELRHVFGAALGHPAGRAALFAWEKASWAKIRARLPNSFGWGQLVGVAGTFCTALRRSEVQAFFSEAARPIEGMTRVLEESMEASGLCVALREKGSSDLSKYLLKTPP
jgi:alanyl aminopeptidase